MQELEDKIEVAADELRQERRRVKSATMERERVEKMAAKLKMSMHELEGRLETEAQRSGEEATYKRGVTPCRLCWNEKLPTDTAAVVCDADVHA